jgi:hypothetical protein
MGETRVKIACDYVRVFQEESYSHKSIIAGYIMEDRGDAECCSSFSIFNEPLDAFEKITIDLRNTYYFLDPEPFHTIEYTKVDGRMELTKGEIQYAADRQITSKLILKQVALTGRYQPQEFKSQISE